MEKLDKGAENYPFIPPPSRQSTRSFLFGLRIMTDSSRTCLSDWSTSSFGDTAPPFSSRNSKPPGRFSSGNWPCFRISVRNWSRYYKTHPKNVVKSILVNVVFFKYLIKTTKLLLLYFKKKIFFEKKMFLFKKIFVLENFFFEKFVELINFPWSFFRKKN